MCLLLCTYICCKVSRFCIVKINISQCNNVEPWWWKANPKGFESLPAPRSGYATTIMICFAHLLIVEYPDHHQSLINSLLYYLGPLSKISSQSVHNFQSNVVHRMTDRHTNTTNNITSFVKVVNIAIYSFYIQMLRSCNTHHNQFFNWLPYLVNIFTLLIINDLD